ncbi:HAD family phosphatase [Streptomyces sp. NPDC000349]|uniref:HAD family hydrolase n=1 Tax=unclassified Streptomyces TaxID=2593676 RepID=UPI00278A11E1|nr:HAD family phosphatase [Streptomyces sp. DSM 40167]MDQ0408822.1 beta-phosphoglucomutase-like phosphatase (HAD superfamily) [Streptomyces sp. DSM 40167]
MNLPPQPVPSDSPEVDELLQDVDGVVVDWDGTVVDNAEIRLSALQQALAPYSVDVDAQWYALNCGLPIREVIARLSGPRTLPVGEIVQASRRLLLGGPPPRLIDSTVELLRRAEALGLPRAVASAAAGILIHPVIERLGLGALLPVVVTAESVAQAKPAPDAYLEAARLIERAPARCLAVDDAPDGITSALEAGMRILAVRDGLLVPVPRLIPG